jgi:SAM-dependent methyltransferase
MTVPDSPARSATLAQHGRAGMEMLGAAQKAAASLLRPVARARFETSEVGVRLQQEGGMRGPAAKIQADLAVASEAASRDPIYRLERFHQRYIAEQIYDRGIIAVEVRRDRLTPARASLPVELEASLDRAPSYHQAVEWHLRPGGWDGYDLYPAVGGLALAPLVFRLGGYAAVPVGENIRQQRRDVIAQLPKARYDRIFEPGCGGVPTLSVLAELFPDAQLVGCDLSLSMLNGGAALAQKLGLKVTLKHRDALRTGEPDASFDAVVTYALHHELPPQDNVALLKEMFRILRPGGDILISDPPPFRAVDPFSAVLLDWETQHREEPFFTQAALTDWAEVLTEIGFEDAQDYPLAAGGYPWVTRARKPS